MPFAWVVLRGLRLGKGFARSDGFWQSGGTAAVSGRSKRHRGLVMCTDQNVMVESKLGSVGVELGKFNEADRSWRSHVPDA